MNGMSLTIAPEEYLETIGEFADRSDCALLRKAIVSVRSHENDASAWARLARLLVDWGRPLDAVQAYQRCLGLEPNWHSCRAELASCFGALGKPQEACDHLVRAFEGDPGNREVLQTLRQMDVFKEDVLEDRVRGTKLRAALKLLNETPPEDIRARGFHFGRKCFGSPLNDPEYLERNPSLTKPNRTPSIDWNETQQLDTLRAVAPYFDELSDLPEGPIAPIDRFYWSNPFFSDADAAVYYGVLRRGKPRQVVEIGCGFSSLILKEAVQRNNSSCHIYQIEPGLHDALRGAFPSSWILDERPLQEVSLDPFRSLGEGDILFYDGSHCAKAGSDVTWFFFRVLPALRKGVWIHLHDIFLPEEYPVDFLKLGRSWNEQYVLEAFLCHNSAYEILYANRYLDHYHAGETEELYKGLRSSFGCSLWMRKTAEG